MLTDNVRDLTRKDYELLRDLVYQQSGIHLGDQKMQLVRARLGKLLRRGRFKSYREYYQYVKDDETGRELCALIDAISTNTTYLFREHRHFEFLKDVLQQWSEPTPAKRSYGERRIWSAGCSSGEEPFSIAMTVADVFGTDPGPSVKILATDISTQMLARARTGQFEDRQVANVPEGYRRRFFAQARLNGERRWIVRPEVGRLIIFSRFNLMSAQFPFRNKFDLIFCRNVMIYFDRSTQEALVGRFANHLTPGGYLLIGHSESLNGVRHPLTYVQPTIYRKPPHG